MFCFLSVKANSAEALEAEKNLHRVLCPTHPRVPVTGA
jgi:hypothetical protein